MLFITIIHCRDDCWSAETRDAHGNLQPSPERFPSGLAALAGSLEMLIVAELVKRFNVQTIFTTWD